MPQGTLRLSPRTLWVHPLQCSCLENPKDGGAWWAAVYGVAQSQTRLKQLSSSSSSIDIYMYQYIFIIHVFVKG